MTEKIKALFIFEILGKPAEHIRITLEQIIDRLGEQKGIKIISRKVHEPRVVEEKEDKKINDKIDNISQDKRDEQRAKQEESKQKITEKENVKKESDFFTTFAEVELTADNLNLIFMIVLNMMPSSVEILEPSELKLKNFDLSRILSDLTVGLHRFDEVAKALAIERHGLMKKLKELEGETGGGEKIEEKETKDRVGEIKGDKDGISKVGGKGEDEK